MNRIKHIAHFCLYLVLVLDSSMAIAEPRTLEIAADPWCPYNCSPSGSQQGFMIDIAKAALALQGYDLDYRIMNWARTKRMVKRGDLDGLVGTSKGDATSTPYYFPKTPLGSSEVCFYRRADDPWVYRSAASLDARIMGWINDYGFEDGSELDTWVKKYKGTPKITTVSGDDLHPRLFKMLLSGRIDTFAEDRSVIAYQLVKSGLQKDIKLAGCTGSSERVFVAFSLQSPEAPMWAEALDRGVTVLQQNGELKQILESYGLTEQAWMGSEE